ncbi:MAG: hypothetical protein RBU30_10785 [Polyangia bacterium]|mgnify:CR=1 FL=1|jgi:hypothetical protein|nr:hypothetical protein [Polyangia bacterium]
MRLVATIWCVLWGLTGPGVTHARSLAEVEVSGAHETGAPLWSICRSFAQPAARTFHEHGPDERHSRSSIKIRVPTGPEPLILETLAEGNSGYDMPGGRAHCVPWGPGITGASSGSLMSASSRDDDEIPICLEGAQCSPVSPERPSAYYTFSADKADLTPPTVWSMFCNSAPASCLHLGALRPGYPEAPFKPPRARRATELFTA